MEKMQKRKRFVLVTGAAGFVGYHLGKALRDDEGIYLIGLDKNSKSKSWQFYNEKIIHELADPLLGGEKKVLGLNIKLDCLVHLAAQTRADITGVASYNSYYKNNVMGTLEAIAIFMGEHNSGATFVNFSSCGASAPWMNPYVVTKLMAEMAVAKALGKSGITFRPSNIYGPQENPKGVFGAWIKRCMTNSPLEINGYGDHVRDFVYVKDLVKYILPVIRGCGRVDQEGPWSSYNSGSGAVLDLGTEEGTTIAKAAALFGEAMAKLDKHPPLVEFHPRRPAGVEKSVANFKACDEITVEKLVETIDETLKFQVVR